jgi:beta-lactamase regulating signal transducer with metallopeptidase domain
MCLKSYVTSVSFIKKILLLLWAVRGVIGDTKKVVVASLCLSRVLGLRFRVSLFGGFILD